MADLRLVRSDGAEVYCTGGITTNGWTVSWEGLSDFLDLPLTVSTSANVLTDGSTVTDQRVEEAERTASIIYKGARGAREVRDEILSFLNPRYSFEAHVTHLGVTRWCEGVLKERQIQILPDRYPLQVTFTLLCTDPFLRSETNHSESFTDAVAYFGFPFFSYRQVKRKDGTKPCRGSLASVRVYDGLNTVYNGGAVPSPFRIEAEFDAEVGSPTFKLNGKHVTVLSTFHPGDLLVIDFEAAPPRVTINGQNSIQMCSRDSDFVGMTLEPGGNTFTYEVGEGQVQTMTVRMLYYDRYLGV